MLFIIVRIMLLYIVAFALVRYSVFYCCVYDGLKLLLLYYCICRGMVLRLCDWLCPTFGGRKIGCISDNYSLSA